MYRDSVSNLLADSLRHNKEMTDYKFMDRKEKAQYIKTKFISIYSCIFR